MIYHITTQEAWDKARPCGHYITESLGQEGFIHCSDGSQVHLTANRFYRGRTDLVLLCIDPTRLTSPLKYETAKDTPGRFPHIYGALQVDAVQSVVALSPKSDGTFTPVRSTS